MSDEVEVFVQAERFDVTPFARYCEPEGAEEGDDDRSAESIDQRSEVAGEALLKSGLVLHPQTCEMVSTNSWYLGWSQGVG